MGLAEELQSITLQELITVLETNTGDALADSPDHQGNDNFLEEKYPGLFELASTVAKMLPVELPPLFDDQVQESNTSPLPPTEDNSNFVLSIKQLARERRVWAFVSSLVTASTIARAMENRDLPSPD